METENLPPEEGARAPRFGMKQIFVLGLFALAIAAVFYFDLDRYLSFQTLKENRAFLTGFVASHMAAAALLFMLVYAASAALSVPGGALLTVTGGFLFGPVLGAGFAVVGATIGATIVFLIARSTLGDYLRARARGPLRRMEKGFNENALNYLLVLRLIPIFPFFVVNIVPAFLGVPLRTYVIATFFGIIPGSLVYTYVGVGLGSILDSNQAFSLTGILTPQIVTALLGLAVLSLMPVAYRKFRSSRATGE